MTKDPFGKSGTPQPIDVAIRKFVDTRMAGMELCLQDMGGEPLEGAGTYREKLGTAYMEMITWEWDRIQDKIAETENPAIVRLNEIYGELKRYHTQLGVQGIQAGTFNPAGRIEEDKRACNRALSNVEREEHPDADEPGTAEGSHWRIRRHRPGRHARDNTGHNPGKR